MKTTLFIALAGAALALSACQKEKSADTTGGGSSGSSDYQPTTAGSTWQYTSSNGDYTETATPTTTGADTTILLNGVAKKFFAIDNSEDGRYYVNKENGVYTSYGSSAQVDTVFALQYLKDAAVGTKWSQSGSAQGISATVNFTIANRDLEKTVKNNTYKSVIDVTYTLSAVIPFVGSVTVATGEDFYAKGVGLIQRIIKDADPSSTQLGDSAFLVHADIK